MRAGNVIASVLEVITDASICPLYLFSRILPQYSREWKRPSDEARQSKTFIARKTLRLLVDAQDECIRFLPNQQVSKGTLWSHDSIVGPTHSISHSGYWLPATGYLCSIPLFA